jgi:hypothetical protein
MAPACLEAVGRKLGQQVMPCLLESCARLVIGRGRAVSLLPRFNPDRSRIASPIA